ncbi:hypothetical protein JCGZ_11937 [Jatropha curcas]|uniref:Uncharacterized protein n=1 Tax=Jatropha curcas TaxID=180498 RepID=A0A067KE03_JATCU|nr:hypothetical protein JCGZ_11937 [Jatropha curcas]
MGQRTLKQWIQAGGSRTLYEGVEVVVFKDAVVVLKDMTLIQSHDPLASASFYLSFYSGFSFSDASKARTRIFKLHLDKNG